MTTPIVKPQCLGPSQVLVDATCDLIDGNYITALRYTLAEAKALTSATENQVIQITDRADGLFEYRTGETANTYDIIAHDTLPLQLKLILTGRINGDWFGAIPDGTAISTGAVDAARNRLVADGVGGDIYYNAGVYLIDATIILKKGIVSKGVGYPNSDTANESTVFKLADNSDTTMFKSFADDLPFLGLADMLIDGNKTNQGAGSWHGIEITGLDLANGFRNLKIQNCLGKGFYANNTTAQEQGTFYLHRIDAVRCDEGGIVTEGNTQNPTFHQCSAEGNGLLATGQFVFIDCGRFSTARLVDCRSECRAQASGGGISGIEVIDANQGNIEIVGGFHQFTEDCTALVRISQDVAASSEARVHISGFQTTNTASDVVIIKDLTSGRELLESQVNARATNIFWEKYPTYISASNSDTFYQKINSNDDTSSVCGGNPNPNSLITANKGSTYERTSGGTFSELYLKVADDGANTGWIGMTGHNSASFSDGDTTPSVASGEGIYSFSNYTGIATITNIDDSIVLGRKIELYNSTANNITIQHGSNIVLNGASDYVMAQNNVLTLRKTGSFWYEVSRG
jgi:hypothetical protein